MRAFTLLLGLLVAGAAAAEPYAVGASVEPLTLIDPHGGAARKQEIEVGWHEAGLPTHEDLRILAEGLAELEQDKEHKGHLLVGDDEVDVSDAGWLRAYMYQGGPPPSRGTDCVRLEGCPNLCGFCARSALFLLAPAGSHRLLDGFLRNSRIGASWRNRIQVRSIKYECENYCRYFHSACFWAASAVFRAGNANQYPLHFCR